MSQGDKDEPLAGESPSGRDDVQFYHRGHLPPPRKIPWELTRPGDLLKFPFRTPDDAQERMWVSIGVSIGDNIIGILVSHPVMAKEVAFGDRIERPRSEAVDFYSERIVESICPTCGRSFKYRPHEVFWDEAAKKWNAQHEHS